MIVDKNILKKLKLYVVQVTNNTWAKLEKDIIILIYNNHIQHMQLKYKINFHDVQIETFKLHTIY